MGVYVEAVIIENFAVDALMLVLAHRLSGVRWRWWGALIGGACGAAFAVAMPFIKMPDLPLAVLKLAVGGLIVGVSARFKGVRQYLASLAFFLALTFASGGALIALAYVTNLDSCAIKGTNCALTASPLWQIACGVGGAALAYTAFRTVLSGRRRALIRGFCRRVALFEGAESAYLDGLVDTGNTLYDTRTLKPICIISPAVADRLYRTGVISYRGLRYVRCATVSGEGKIAVFEIDRLVIYSGEERHIIDNAIMGVSPKELSGAEVIVHAALVMGEQ